MSDDIIHLSINIWAPDENGAILGLTEVCADAQRLGLSIFGPLNGYHVPSTGSAVGVLVSVTGGNPLLRPLTAEERRRVNEILHPVPMPGQTAEPEINVTSEMIDAGMAEFFSYDPERGTVEAQDVVKAIFLQMAGIRRAKAPK